MATKTIAVTLASIQNTGKINISPRGIMQCRTVRAVDDEQVFQRGTLYFREQGERPVPMHPSGAQFIPPGESLSYNVMEQLAVSQFDEESERKQHFNQMLMLFAELTQRVVVSGNLRTEPYFGDSFKHVRFDDIDGFNTVTCFFNTATEDVARFTVTYTVSLLKEDRR
jgi:hypothetical protein